MRTLILMYLVELYMREFLQTYFKFFKFLSDNSKISTYTDYG